MNRLLKGSAGGLLLLLIALSLPFYLGSVLPVDHELDRYIRVQPPPAEVFPVIEKVRAYPSWRRGVERVDLLSGRGEEGTRWREVREDGSVLFERTAVDSPTLLIRRIVETDLPFRGEWRIQILQPDTGSLVTVSERGRIEDPLDRFVAGYLAGRDAWVQRFLEDLRRKTEQ